MEPHRRAADVTQPLRRTGGRLPPALSLQLIGVSCTVHPDKTVPKFQIGERGWQPHLRPKRYGLNSSKPPVSKSTWPRRHLALRGDGSHKAWRGSAYAGFAQTHSAFGPTVWRCQTWAGSPGWNAAFRTVLTFSPGLSQVVNVCCARWAEQSRPL